MVGDETRQAGSPPDPASAPAGSANDTPDPAGEPWLRESGQLVRGAAALLAQHWLPLLAIGAASLLAHELLSRLAVAAGLVGAVPGFLALALVPLASLAALVGMLLVVRSREARRSNFWGVIAAAGSVLVPFLVVYESRGDLRADLINYVRGTLYEQLGAETIVSGLPQIASWLVLGIVATALVVRAVGARLASNERWGLVEGPRRGVLHIVVGYAEVVWMTLGAWVLTGVLSGLSGWWSTRSVAQGLSDVWARVRENLPSLGAFGDWMFGAVPVLTDAVVTGLVVPISVLTIAVIVYGLQVADTVRPDDVVAVVRRGRWRALTGRVGDAPLRQAWSRLSDTEGHFGALVGGLALVMRSAFAPVLAYCVLFTLLAQLDVVVWWVARLVLGWRREIFWEAVYAPIEGVAQLLTLVLTVALTAVFADRLLTRFGAAGQLGFRGPRPRREAAAAR
ncbi:hypothetical protein MWU75_08100 [Ornithinimicrobium sp. F0845]|uniref:hypothetical protein n=1 Tax=Ornithinimicrobium sp. F0845 TaxID=2926412 RepID=UPI001FF2E797|nr:hypothetical protein [Ornithinimicrobium sp. F0845]MCK0112095.1 hypothetical protein [Ornithinimicrobium sp. F0845]